MARKQRRSQYKLLSRECLGYRLWVIVEDFVLRCKRYSLTVDSFGKRNFLVAYGKKSLEEIFFKMLLRKKYFREIAILKRFLDRLGP